MRFQEEGGCTRPGGTPLRRFLLPEEKRVHFGWLVVTGLDPFFFFFFLLSRIALSKDLAPRVLDPFSLISS